MGEEEVQYSYSISYSYIQNFATEESIPIKIGEDTSIIAYVYQKDSTPVVPGIASQLIGITELPELKVNSNIENAYTEYDGAYYLNVSSYNFINDTDVLNSWRKQVNKDNATYLNISMYADDHNSYVWHKTSIVTYSYECTNEAQYKRDLAAKLYANSAFVSGLTGYALDPYTIAKEAINRANILWETLPSSWKK